MSHRTPFPMLASLLGLRCLLPAVAVGADDVAEEPVTSAAWELRLLGVDGPERLAELRAFPKRRRVRLGVVGSSGVSRNRLERFFDEGNRIIYHDCADPDANTHDTQMSRVIFEITRTLGVRIELHAWQAGPSLDDYAEKFGQAGGVAQIVSLYQSFWGEETPAITEAIRGSPGALFISPYVEHGGNPTGNTPQGSACRPWQEGTIGHFVTVAPLARRDPSGRILTPSDRGPSDSEAINFIAPSYHANGPGGTCPSAAVAVACAAYLVAVSPEVPKPGEIVALLRETSAIDRAVLASDDGFAGEAVDRLQKQVGQLRNPPDGKQRKLDAPGVLNLYRAYQRSGRRENPAVEGVEPEQIERSGRSSRKSHGKPVVALVSS